MKATVKFEHSKIEAKWQGEWNKKKLYNPDIGKAKKPFYNLWMFPYPSAEGLHAGHAFASTGSDIYGRFKRMHGYDVFQPIGYDSFGIHSENFAIKIGKTPQEMLKQTTKHYEEQLKSLGHAYDWTKTVTTSDPDYYKWTQWLFVKLFKTGLAERAKSKVNWCPSCKTVISDEQVIEGKCERCESMVEKKDLLQWHFRITRYADKLLDNLEKIDWPAKIKTAQMNWIGKKEGINIGYKVEESGDEIVCWTSRPETNFGATFIVIAPEHPLALKVTTKENNQKVSEYIKNAQKTSYEERIANARSKSGVFTGAYAVNKLNGTKLPVWVSDFVVMGVGTGAVVGVPGHDLRDFEFAKQFDLPVKRVVIGKNDDTSDITKPEQVQEEEGIMINSEFLGGLDIHKAKIKMMDYLEEKSWGKRETTYHLRDWLISRQRYWGPPIPMIYCQACAKKGKGFLNSADSGWDSDGWYPVDEKDLPIILPEISDYKPKGEGAGPLSAHPEFYNCVCPACGAAAKRETDVSDTFLDSSWYFLRYPSVDSPHAVTEAFDKTITKKWLPVNLYFGGAEHAVLHLMYARFITMVLYDLKLVDFEEPFPKFFAHGLMIKDGAKMSKSRGNVVNPDGYITKYGADALRLYLMFMGPVDGYPDFRDTGIEGMRRFVERVWKLYVTHKDLALGEKDTHKLSVKLNQTINKVTKDISEFKYNTAIASLMELINCLYEIAEKAKKGTNQVWTKALHDLALMLAPYAPHMAEEIWVSIMGELFSVHSAIWPEFDPSQIFEDKITVVIQIDGKLKGQLVVNREEAVKKEKIEKLARNDTKVNSKIAINAVSKVIFVPGKLINFVTGK